MSLDRSCADLLQRWQALGDHVTALRMTIVEDRPLDLDLALVDRRGDALDDLQSIIEAGAAAARLAGQTLAAMARGTGAWAAVGAALLRSQDRHCAAAGMLWPELLSFERLREVRSAGQRHGGEWIPWARRVQTDLGRVPGLLHAVAVAHLDCWRAVVEGGLRVARPGVVVGEATHAG